MYIKSTILSLFLVIAVSNAVLDFIHPGKEYIYNYNGRINVGTYKPALFASQFVLDGKIHLQNHQNTILMRLSDLTMKIKNGEVKDHEHLLTDADALNLPDEIKDLLKPIQIGYNEDGKIKYFAADKNDPKSSRNMKKAIASLLQMDVKKARLDETKIHAFTTHEDSTYGNVLVRYRTRIEGDEIIVQKMLDVKSSQNWMDYFGVTDADRSDEFSSRSAISVDAYRDFGVFKNEDGLFFKELLCHGDIFTHPMKGASDTQYMNVNQTLRLDKIIPITDKIEMNEDKSKEDLAFILEFSEDDETFVDFSFGRAQYTMERYEKFTNRMMDELIAHTHVNHLVMVSPDMKGTAMNQLLRGMRMLDLSTLEKIFLEMEEQSKHDRLRIFQEMIPLVGTRASIKFLRNLIRKQKVQDNVAIEMLQKMPFHLRMPSDKLLIEVEDLMNLENVSPKVHQAAVLSFATLIHKVHSHYLMRHNLVKQSSPKENLLEKFITKYMDLLKVSQDYEHQFLYMNALYNIKMGSVAKHLEPYVTGEATSNHHLRYLAMCASLGENIKNKKRVYELYMPILSDHSLHLELRAAALYTIMATKPTKEKLLDLNWILDIEQSDELYHFYYTFLESLVNTQDLNWEGYRDIAREILNVMRKPYRPRLSGNYVAVYMDPRFGFGSMFEISLIKTNTSISTYFSLGSTMYNFPVKDMVLWLKIDGVDTSLIETKQVLNSIEQLFALVEQLENQKNLHVEYSLMRNNKNIEINFGDNKSIKNLKNCLMNLMPSESSLDISNLLAVETILPNDLGMLSMYSINIMSLTNNQMENSEDPNYGKMKNWKYQRSANYVFGLDFYNPVIDVWQGVNRVQMNEIIVGLDFEPRKRYDRYEFRIFNQRNNTRDKFAMRNYATSSTYVYKDSNNILQKSSKDSKHFAKVTTEDAYRKGKVLFEFECEHTGLNFQVAVFDTKRHISLKTIMDELQVIKQSYFKNYKTMPLGYMLITLQNAMNYLMISPEIGTFGLLIRATPSEKQKYPVDNIEFGVIIENSKFVDVETAQILRSWRINADLITRERYRRMVNKWHIRLDFDLDLELNFKNGIFHYQRLHEDGKHADKELVTCIEAKREIKDDKILGSVNITLSGENINFESCIGELGVLNMEIRAVKSEEQLEMMKNNLTYKECMPEHVHNPLLRGVKVNYENNMECMLMKTSLRSLEIEMRTSGDWTNFWESYENDNRLTGMLWPYYSRKERFNDFVEENSAKIYVDFPNIGDEVTIGMNTKNAFLKLTDMPNCAFTMVGLTPENLLISELFSNLYHLNMIESCLITDRHILTNDNELLYIEDKEWMSILHSNPSITTNHTLDILVKGKERQTALKIKMDDKELEITPEDKHNNKVMLDGKELTLTKNFLKQENWLSIGMLDDHENTIIMHLPNMPLYITYDGERIEIFKIMTDLSTTGKCFP